MPILARLMLPDDANPAGNVHGGTILQLMEQAGMVVATRHCNIDESEEFRGKKIAGLARFETMSFHQPMYVGEVASAAAYIIFTSERSILVKVTVTAENAASGKKRVTNSGELWYLSFVSPKYRGEGETEPLTTSVPQIEVPTEGVALKEYLRGKGLYDVRKGIRRSSSNVQNEVEEVASAHCLDIDGCLCPACRSKFRDLNTSGDLTPAESRQTLCQMVLPGDCGISDVAFGGFVMKLMDTAAGCCAARHCRTNVVTVSISCMDLVGFVKLGDIATIDAIATFASSKSLEIAVTAKVSSFDGKDRTVAEGNFTFVSLNKERKVIPIPRLALNSHDEFERAFYSQRRYESAKKARRVS